MALTGAVLIVFSLLLLSEIWWRSRELQGEFSRKFVHITVGSFVAFWPYLLTADDIKLLSVAFLVGVIISKQLHVFRAIHSVQRPTWGELLFAVAVGGLAFVAPRHPHIYTAALLEMSLADGLAAVIGTRFGNGFRYTVFGAPKSAVGTLTFLVVSVAILVGFALTNAAIGWPLVAGVALIATLLENVSVRGTDNLVVPLFVAAALLLAV